ncbi:hypothetical protein SISNIDRAFT_470293 [Sistotremastrum niveocremeum HHB9708]|uniref:Uncharacterized protein n=1 Tax=Sistotremastrum niveocremeum HHB9708 TaxID=1314777 RepID=A0A164P2S6_9AGAM|nr:hypothetical protein SISNIDRAFT_470293 [Sistotremastrum niveocremeum HHB9708]
MSESFRASHYITHPRPSFRGPTILIGNSVWALVRISSPSFEWDISCTCSDCIFFLASTSVPSPSSSTSIASAEPRVGDAYSSHYRKLAPKPQGRRGRPKQTTVAEVDPAYDETRDLEKQRARDLQSQLIVWDMKRDASLSHRAPRPQEQEPRPFLWLNPQTGQNSVHALQTPPPSSSVHMSHPTIPHAPTPISQTGDMHQTLPHLQEHFSSTLDAWNPGDAGDRNKKIVPRYSPYDWERPRNL